MVSSEPQSHISESDRENVIQTFQDWRPKGPLASEALASPNMLSRPSAARRVFRTISFGLIAVFIALAVVVWQSGSQEKAKVVSAFLDWATRFTSASQYPPALPTEAARENKVAQAAPPVATPKSVEEQYGAIKQQIEALTSQIAEVRHIAEQLAANQGKMGEDIAALMANEESINKKILAASTHPAAAAAVPKKKPQEPARLGTTGHSSSERSSVGAPLPLR